MISSVIVSFDDQSNDESILIVGKKRKNESVEIINAIQGNEATELYKRLTTAKVAPSTINVEGGSHDV